jgi:hypothetical protein
VNDGVTYREDIGVDARGWALFAFAVIATAVIIGPRFVPVTMIAWIINLIVFYKAAVIVDGTTVIVSGRRAPLSAFDPATLDRASNHWPWRSLNPGYLGANPVWTRDSVAMRGSHNGRTVWLNVGTNRRDELVGALLRGIALARQ